MLTCVIHEDAEFLTVGLVFIFALSINPLQLGIRCCRCIEVSTNLSAAKLVGASLRDANLKGAIIKDADFTGADLTGARVTESQLATAITCDTTGPTGELLNAGC